MSKLWQKKKSDKLNQAIENFEVGEDYILDLKLVQYDIYGSIAHGKMLAQIGILTKDEFKKIKTELLLILKEHLNGNFSLSIEDEDVHSKIENLLTQKLGEAGKKIHTARSRNDQILVDTRLYTKNELILLQEKVIDLAKSILQFAKQYEFIPMPGYTHMQLAMPSSIGMWAGSFTESLIDELTLLKTIYELNDQCPLGSGAAYGVAIPIDREMTQNLLGFQKLQLNSIYCANSRGKMEANVISAIVSLAMVLNKMASDLLLFTTKEFDFFEVADEITTGSSIMPQKKNLDVLELIRGKIASLLGLENSSKNLITNLPSGYNRDFQDCKKFLISAFDTILPMLPLMKITIENLKPKEDKLIAAHKKEIYATNAAYKLVMDKKIPFRDAYRQIGNNLDQLDRFDPYEVVQSSTALGSTGCLLLNNYEQPIQKHTEYVHTQRSEFEWRLNKLCE